MHQKLLNKKDKIITCLEIHLYGQMSIKIQSYLLCLKNGIDYTNKIGKNSFHKTKKNNPV